MIKLIYLLKEIIEDQEDSQTVTEPKKDNTDDTSTFNLPSIQLDDFIRGIKEVISNFEYEEITTQEGNFLQGFQSKPHSPVFKYNIRTQTLEYYPTVPIKDKFQKTIKMSQKFIENAIKVGKDTPLNK